MLCCSRLHQFVSLTSPDVADREKLTSSLVESRSIILNMQISSQDEDFFSDVKTSLRLCIETRNPRLGSCIHGKILKSGLDSNLSVSNSLLDVYAKNGRIEDAVKWFDYMPQRTVVSWTSVMSGYTYQGLADEAINLFRQMLEALLPNDYALAVLLQACVQKGDHELLQVIHSYSIKLGFISDVFLQNSMISAYAKSRMPEAAEDLLLACNCRDVVSWTSIISGCVYSGLAEKALLLFFRMQEQGIMPNVVTILSILRACSSINEWKIFQWIHGLIMKAEWSGSALVMNSFVEMYAVNGYFSEGMRIFCYFCFTCEVRYLTPETMATLLQGCGHSHLLELGREIHGYLIKHRFLPCTTVENSLIDMYAQNEQDDSSFRLFTRMSCRDLISWNTMMTCLVNNDRPSEALDLLSDIHANEGDRSNIFPDVVTVLASIQACSHMASLHLGQIIHGYTARKGLIHDFFVGNSLIDLYGKSGRLDLAYKMFDEMSEKDIGSWNSMIAACGINGDGNFALRIFMELERSGLHQPNTITFVNVLSACAHAGLVEEGLRIFSRLKRNWNVEPSIEHFACVVDLLGRSGKVEEALELIEKMPLKPGPDLWGTLLGSCMIFGNVETAQKAAKQLSILESNGTIWRVAFSNVCASAGKWDNVTDTRAEIRRLEEPTKKGRGGGGGWSSIEVRGEAFRFMAGDTKHPESRTIYEVLNRIHEQIRDAVAMAEIISVA